MWLQSRNLSLFSFKNRFSVFPPSLNTLAAHDGRTRGAETNLRLFYPMFVFPQAVPQHMLGTSQTARAGRSTPRRSFWWKPHQATLEEREKSQRKAFMEGQVKWTSTPLLPAQSTQSDQKLDLYASQADAAKIHRDIVTIYTWLWGLGLEYIQ